MYLTVLVVAAALYTVYTLWDWRRHYLKAQATGLPCVLVPGLPISPVMRLVVLALFSLLKQLPRTQASAWTPTWLRYLDIMSAWHDGYGSYQRVGGDAYVLVAPTALMIVTCAPDAIDEILHHRDAFPRPVDLFSNIGRYGKNLACSEGAQWRRMRRPVSRAFGDRNHREVWRETLYQAPRMLRSWTCGQSIPLDSHTRRISQNILSKGAFGYRMPWSDEPVAREEETTNRGLSYMDASRGLVHNILVVIGLPKPFLRYVPFPFLQRVNRYDVAFRAHVQDTIEHCRHTESSGDDILHALLRGPMAAKDDDDKDYERLSDSDVLGNSFLLILGGHETVATSLQLALLFLALDPATQKNVQDDIDSIVGQLAPEDWTFDGHLPQLLTSWVGAVMQEQLRFVPPVPFVLTRASGYPTVSIDGVRTPISDGTFVSLSQLGAQRNPKHWPQVAKIDLEEFQPGRWFITSSNGKPQTESQEPSKRACLFRPQNGTYFPFSDGARKCPGRRFAQIEHAAILAVIFQSHSIELDLRGWVSDIELDRMTPAERDSVWQKAATRARNTIRDDMQLILTMHLKQNFSLPVRLVERGHERFGRRRGIHPA